jgi:hypothetical protein
VELDVCLVGVELDVVCLLGMELDVVSAWSGIRCDSWNIMEHNTNNVKMYEHNERGYVGRSM